MNIKIKNSLIAVSAIIVCASCATKENPSDVPQSDGITITADVAETRAALSGSWLEYPIGVYLVHSPSVPGPGQMYAENREYVGDGYFHNSIFRPRSGALPWPENGMIGALSYSPYTEEAEAVFTQGNDWSLEVSIPVDNNKSDQDDLVGACDFEGAAACGSEESIYLKYKHLMARVDVELYSSEPLAVFDVKVDNVCLSATQHVVADAHSSSWNGTWIDKAAPATYSLGNGSYTKLFRYEEKQVPPSDGGLVKTGRSLDLGLDDASHNGPGSYFQVEVAGELMYTRNGRFYLNQDGTVVDENGFILQPEFAVPEETAKVTVSKSGHIAALDYEGQEIAGAEIPLYTFIGAPKHLFGRYYIPFEGEIIVGDTRLPGSGPETEGVPGQDNVSRIWQGYWNSTDENYYKIGDHFDIAIRGEGYYQVEVNGELMYTRDGTFCVNEDGTVVDKNGFILQPEFAVPYESFELGVSPFGHIAAIDGNQQEIAGAEIPLYTFFHPEKLDERKIGNKIYYTPTEESGPELEGIPGQDGVGTLVMGYTNELALYSDLEPLKYGKSLLCIPDRKESDAPSSTTPSHSITIQVSGRIEPSSNITVGGNAKEVTIPVADEWIEGHRYVYRIDCSNLEKAGVLKGQVSPWENESINELVK